MTSSASVVCPLTPVQIVPPRKNVEDTGGTYRTNPPAVRFRIPGMERMHSYERSVAVIGSGVAGLAAAYALSARDRVTLFEADTRIGGHAHTHYVDRRRRLHRRRRHRPSWCTTTAPTRRCAGCSPNSASPPRRPTCRCRCATTAAGWSTPGHAASAGCSRRWSSLARPRYLLMLAEVKRFHRGRDPAAADADADDADARRVPGPARLLQLLRRPLHDAAGRGGVVVRRRARRCATRRAICSCSSSTTACCRCSARRRGAPWSAARPTTSRRSLNRLDEVRAGDPVTSVRRVPDGVQM